jgi:WD repeat-containing protein 68
MSFLPLACATHNFSLYTYTTRYDPTSQFRLAIGSYIEQYCNNVQIIKKRKGTTKHDNLDQALYCAGFFDHPYPCTKILWTPDMRNQGAKDLLGTTGDYLRIWRIYDDPSSGNNTNMQNVVPKKECLLNNNKTSEYCAPLTSFDWNETDPNLVGTSSIDTTCTVWDLETQTARTQLIAHDKEVFDLAFTRYVHTIMRVVVVVKKVDGTGFACTQSHSLTL